MIANQTSNKNVIALFVVLLIVFAGLVLNIVQVVKDASNDAEYLETTSDLRVLAQQISTHSREAAEGKQTSFEELERVRRDFSASVTRLAQGDESLPSLAGQLPKGMVSLDKVWKRVDGASQTIYANKARVLFLHEVASTLSASIPELQQKYDTVVDILNYSNATSRKGAQAQKKTWRAERIKGKN
jgi:twitching motility protein PilJ